MGNPYFIALFYFWSNTKRFSCGSGAVHNEKLQINNCWWSFVGSRNLIQTFRIDCNRFCNLTLILTFHAEPSSGLCFNLLRFISTYTTLRKVLFCLQCHEKGLFTLNKLNNLFYINAIHSYIVYWSMSYHLGYHSGVFICTCWQLSNLICKKKKLSMVSEPWDEA